MMRIACLALLASMLVVGCNAADSDNSSAGPALPDNRQAGTHERVEALIKTLGEENDNRQGALAAWIALRDLGPEAFPEVVAHLDDADFAFQMDSGSTYENWSVGRACHDLLWCNLEPYNKAVMSSSIPERKLWWRPVYTDEFLHTATDARAWLAEHLDRSLVDLQIEVLQWVTTHHSDRDAEISAEDKAELVALLDDLKAKRTSLAPAIAWAR